MDATFGNLADLIEAQVAAGARPGADSGTPQVASAELFAAQGVEAGVWSCSPGGWAIDNRPDTEIVLVLSGRATITDAGGTERVVGEGDVFVLPRGWSGRWDIEETVEKLYVVVTDDREGME